MLLNDFRVKTTKEFDIDILVDGEAPVLTIADVITFIMKIHIDDSDVEAVISQVGVNTETAGRVHFKLTPEDTDIPAGRYYAELKWDSNGDIEILDSDTITVLKRVFD
jgi:hypothetical protein